MDFANPYGNLKSLVNCKICLIKLNSNSKFAVDANIYWFYVELF